MQSGKSGSSSSSSSSSSTSLEPEPPCQNEPERPDESAMIHSEHDGSSSEQECEADQEGTNVWPKGSSEYSDLFDWPAGNASKMFLADPVFIENFKELFRTCKIEVFDSFAGTGNGSTAFKLQHRALAEALRLAVPADGVRTLTACDCDKLCQKALGNLSEDSW
ncbi:unnamed protein product [Durusdinium trenchii]|uniref:Uncharacterized protein n=1 Tax=Durusdinium trenchii TaxID=1381693 RepID=A0ABP0NFW5_9DINO